MATSNAIYRLKITLRDSKPAIWRRVEVLRESTLGELHRIIQGIMGWEEAHLHQFTFGKRKRPGDKELKRWMKAGGADVDELWGERHYSDPLYELENAHDEWMVTLESVAPAEKVTFVYTYDFGDGWAHEVRVEKIMAKEAGVKYPRCTGGAQRAPMEDSGSIMGWEDKLVIIDDPTHEEHEFIRGWMGLRKGEVFDATEFDAGETNRRLAKMIKSCDRARKAWLKDVEKHGSTWA